jgi:hypothetical protein
MGVLSVMRGARGSPGGLPVIDACCVGSLVMTAAPLHPEQQGTIQPNAHRLLRAGRDGASAHAVDLSAAPLVERNRSARRRSCLQEPRARRAVHLEVLGFDRWEHRDAGR